MTTPSGLVILAGGENSRLEPLGNTVYKAFLPIHGASLAARQVLQAQLAGLRTAVIVPDEFDPVSAPLLRADPFKVSVRPVRGTMAKKIATIAALFESWRPLLVCLGDTVAKVDLPALAAATAQPGVDSAIAVAPHTLPFGVVSTEGDRVVGFTEKPRTEYLVNVGYMAIGPKGLDRLTAGTDLAGCLTWLAGSGELAAVRTDQFVAVDDLPSLADAHRRLEHSEFGQ